MRIVVTESDVYQLPALVDEWKLGVYDPALSSLLLLTWDTLLQLHFGREEAISEKLVYSNKLPREVQLSRSHCLALHWPAFWRQNQGFQTVTFKVAV